jgi:hypothetical protein
MQFPYHRLLQCPQHLHHFRPVLPADRQNMHINLDHHVIERRNLIPGDDKRAVDADEMLFRQPRLNVSHPLVDDHIVPRRLDLDEIPNPFGIQNFP